MAKLPSLYLGGSLDLRGDVIITCELSEAWDQASSAAVQGVMSDFVAAGNRGAYPSVGASPKASHLAQAGRPVVQGTSVRFSLMATSVDGRACQLLRHMVSRLDLGDAYVSRIDVHPPGGGSPRMLPVIDDDNETDAYPPAPDPCRFAVEWSDDGGGKRRRVVVEFGAEIGGAEIDALKEPVDCWARLLERGAFAMPLGLPDDLDNVMGQVALFDAWSAEIEVPVYKSSEVGWNVLLNLLEATSLGIVRVEVE